MRNFAVELELACNLIHVEYGVTVEIGTSVDGGGIYGMYFAIGI